jgi:hypothetical protein
MSGGLLPGYDYGTYGGNITVWRNTANGPQEVYSGPHSVVAMVPAGKGGVDTLFSDSTSLVHYSPDGNNIYSSTYAYNGTQSVVQRIGVAGGGVDTLFSGSSSRVYFSPDGRSIGGGGNTIYGYNGTQSVIEMVPDGLGVDTLFDGGGLSLISAKRTYARYVLSHIRFASQLV